MKRLTAIGALLTITTFGLTRSATADLFTGFYDFGGTQYTDDFTDLRRGPNINSDGVHDVNGTEHSALNFTGRAGTGVDTWLTKWTPGGSPGVFNGRCGTSVFANLLIHPFNNRKGVGLVALLNDAQPGDRGIALIVNDSGNNDVLQLVTINPFTGAKT